MADYNDRQYSPVLHHMQKLVHILAQIKQSDQFHCYVLGRGTNTTRALIANCSTTDDAL